MPQRAACLLLVLACLAPAQDAPPPAQEVPAGEVPVGFVVNDALVKDQALAGVRVSAARVAGGHDGPEGTTDAGGRVELRLAPGKWFVSYALQGYVPLGDTPLEVAGPGQVVTTSLIPALEGEGPGGGPVQRRVALVLNWGADRASHVRDADSHLALEHTHVYFGARNPRDGMALDVDDTDWGGPETITLIEPGPGRYVYWVHDWSDGPGQLGSSSVVVRLLVGDTLVGTWAAPAHATTRVWRPFQALEVTPDGTVTVRDFTPAELSAGQDLNVPGAVTAATGWSGSGSNPPGALVCCVLLGFPLALGAAAALFRKAIAPGK